MKTNTYSTSHPLCSRKTPHQIPIMTITNKCFN